MKSRHQGSFGVWLGVAVMVLGGALAQAATPKAKATNDSDNAARLLNGIKADAVQVQSAADAWENLTKSSTASWKDYDRQWNNIAPPVEDMQIKLARLEEMSSSLSEAQRNEATHAKQAVQEIRDRTNQLSSLLNAPGFTTTNTGFRTDTRTVARDAGKIEKTVSAG